jgi:hypothetical protein
VCVPTADGDDVNAIADEYTLNHDNRTGGIQWEGYNEQRLFVLKEVVQGMKKMEDMWGVSREVRGYALQVILACGVAAVLQVA